MLEFTVVIGLGLVKVKVSASFPGGHRGGLRQGFLQRSTYLRLSKTTVTTIATRIFARNCRRVNSPKKVAAQSKCRCGHRLSVPIMQLSHENIRTVCHSDEVIA